MCIGKHLSGAMFPTVSDARDPTRVSSDKSEHFSRIAVICYGDLVLSSDVNVLIKDTTTEASIGLMDILIEQIPCNRRQLDTMCN